MTQQKLKVSLVDNPVTCSFCGCTQHQVAEIVRERDGVAICDNCVAICVQVMVDHRRERAGLPVLSGRH